MKPCYFIAGGGTGGHIFPAVAIGEALKTEVPEARLFFVGTNYGLEKKLIPKLGYPLLTLPIRGLLGKGLAKKLALLWRLPLSMLLSLFYLLRYRPKVVVGVGGYASGPLLWTAAVLRRPTLIQEQNAHPGLTNRLCGKVARMACLGFAEAAPKLACTTLVTGNPVRPEFTHRPAWEPSRTLLLVLGGSQGAKALNEELPKLLEPVLRASDRYRLIHQAGRNRVDAVREAYGTDCDRIQVVDFIDDVATLMDQVRLVICRAGASTISELKHLRIPCVLIPFPGAAEDHQTHNAKSISGSGAAWLLPEAELPGAGEKLQALIGDDKALRTMADAYPKSNANSARACAKAILALEKGAPAKRIVEELRAYVS